MNEQPVLRPKVALKFPETSPTRPASRTMTSRPVSPLKTQSTNSATTSTTTNGTPIKARAKVNSSAITNPKQKSIRSATPVTTARSTVTASTRPRTSDGPIRSRPQSPVKSPPSSARTAGTLSPPSSASSTQPRIRSTLSATPTIPQLRTRAQTASAYDLRSSTPDIPRTNDNSPNNTSSLQHVSSYASLNPNVIKASSRRGSPPLSDINGRSSPAPKVKIKAKVSGLAKQGSEVLSPTASTGGPAYPSTRISGHMRRTPSTSSAVSGLSLASSPPPSTSHTPAHTSHGPGPVFYPITTAVPAANPHRYTPAWTQASSSQPNINHIPPRERHDTIQPRVNGMGIKIVDPATIPLPANSPPASAVSFSSRSSVSRSSLSHANDSTEDLDEVEAAQTNGIDPRRSSLNTLVRFHEMSTDEENLSGDSGMENDDDMHQERKVRAEAKSNRKIADLEITNKSLLAINSTLESAKHRQAKEIRELKRKLRESRLILPPRTYKAVKSSLDHDDTAEDDEISEEEEQEEEEQEQEGDESYRRVKMLLEGLIDSGKKALEKKPEDFVGKGGAAKVLHADELRDDGDGDALSADQDSYFDADDDTGSFMLGSQIPPRRGSLNPDDKTVSNVSSRAPSPTPPPIVVTHT